MLLCSTQGSDAHAERERMEKVLHPGSPSEEDSSDEDDTEEPETEE
jgi:hypothetical protein